MGRKRKDSKLVVDKYSVKWITPWADCAVIFDESGGDFLFSASSVPCPTFNSNEWRRFCDAVNSKIKTQEKDE